MQPSFRPRDKHSPTQVESSTHSIPNFGEVEIDSEATTEREGTQDPKAIDTDPRTAFHTMHSPQSSPAPLKRQIDEVTYPANDSFPGQWLFGLGDKRFQPAKEDAKSYTTEASRGPARYQILIARIREAEVRYLTSRSLLYAYYRTDAEQQSLIEAER